MLTFVEAISLAGDRAKQNDDAFGCLYGSAWIIDGATDLHDAPISGWTSDAAWIAHVLNAMLHSSASADAGGHASLRKQLRRALDERIVPEFTAAAAARSIERWRRPIASVLMLNEVENGVAGVDLGDCRLATLSADGGAEMIGGPRDAADAEAKLAAQQTDSEKPLLQRERTLARLREMRATLNREGARWTFTVDAACVDHAASWLLTLKRPAHLLLMTDGFAALTDRYGAYDPAALIGVALDTGLQELGRELRAIEAADAAGSLHPRFKKSDDATALLLRLT